MLSALGAAGRVAATTAEVERRTGELRASEAYVTKPASLETLRGLLERWVGAVADEPASTPRANGAGELDDQPHAVLAVERLQALVGHDPAVVREFLEDYRAQAGPLADQLHAAAEADSVDVVATLAHRLESSSRAVGAMRFAEVCSTLEAAARAGEPSRVEQILTAFTSAQQELAGSVADLLGQREG